MEKEEEEDYKDLHGGRGVSVEVTITGNNICHKVLPTMVDVTGDKVCHAIITIGKVTHIQDDDNIDKE